MMSVLSVRVQKYTAAIKINILNYTVYGANMAADIPLILLRLWIYSQFYPVIYADGAKFDGLSVAQLVWVFMFLQSFEASTYPTLSKMIDEEVRTGSLAYSINRPYSYLLFHAAGFIGRTLPGLVLGLTIGSIATYFLVGPFHPSVGGILGGLLCLCFGLILHLLFELLIGLSAFWLEETKTLEWLYQRMVLIAGGYTFPISIFPEPVRSIIEILPFSQLFHSAARLTVKFQSTLFYQYVRVQCFWILILGVVVYVLFKRGIKNVSVHGG